MPRNHRFTSSDIVLSIDSLARSYPLCQILNALFSNASVALNSVAGENVDFALATNGISPTVIVASSATMAMYHDLVMKPHSGIVASIGRWAQARTLDSGNMPSNNILSRLSRVGPTAELSLDNLRLLCISHRIDADVSARLSSQQLTNLRIFIGARIVYALTGPGIAGAITQTNFFDYRCSSGPSHFGAPVSSTEITLTGVSETASSETPLEGQVSSYHFAPYLFYWKLTPDLLRSQSLVPPWWVGRLHYQREHESAKTTLWNCARSLAFMFRCLSTSIQLAERVIYLELSFGIVSKNVNLGLCQGIWRYHIVKFISACAYVDSRVL